MKSKDKELRNSPGNYQWKLFDNNYNRVAKEKEKMLTKGKGEHNLFGLWLQEIDDLSTYDQE